MPNYDLTTASGQQEFQRWVTELIRNEVNSYIKQVLFDRNAQYIDGAIVDPSTGNPLSGAALTTARVDRLEQAVFRR